MTERRIEYMPLRELAPALRNPKRHELAELRRSFERFGFTIPVILDERTGRLVAGHGRAQLMQIEEQAGRPAPAGVRVDKKQGWLAPVVRGWSSADDAEADAYLVADNRLTELAQWDTGALLDGLQALGLGPGIDGTGFTADDVDDLYARLQEEQAKALENPGPQTRNAQVRSLVLDYPLEQYGYVAATAARARAHYDAPSNAELFVAMLREWKGSAA